VGRGYRPRAVVAGGGARRPLALEHGLDPSETE
jgi:hypothetical protein